MELFWLFAQSPEKNEMVSRLLMTYVNCSAIRFAGHGRHFAPPNDLVRETRACATRTTMHSMRQVRHLAVYSWQLLLRLYTLLFACLTLNYELSLMNFLLHLALHPKNKCQKRKRDTCHVAFLGSFLLSLIPNRKKPIIRRIHSVAHFSHQ